MSLPIPALPTTRPIDSSSRPSGHGAGFSLVELLITLGILALLLGIGLPSYSEIMQRHQRSQAQQCLFAIAQAMEREFLLDFLYPEEVPFVRCHVASELGPRYPIHVVVNSQRDEFVLQLIPVDPDELTRCGWLELDSLGRLEIQESGAGPRCW